MGKLFSHGNKVTKTESKSSDQQESWLERNPQYQALQLSGLNEASNFNMPGYQLAGTNDLLQKSMTNLANGPDISKYKNASDYFQSAGQQQYENAEQNLANYKNTVDRIGGMGQSDYQNMVNSEFNSDLVNQQISEATQDINDEYNSQVQNLNQQATATGNMGNSRAGVAQGVMAGKAQRAIGSASVQYRSAEENAAFQRVQAYLGNTMKAAQTGIDLYQNQASQGLNMYNTGMNYYNAYNRAQQQNYINQFNLGQYQQQQQQNQLDVARQNQIMGQSPALQRLAYFNETYLPMAQLQTYGQSQGSSTTTQVGAKASIFGGITGAAGAAIGGIYGLC